MSTASSPNGEPAQRTVFYVSDGTGITAESLGHSLLSQFEGINFHQVRLPFVDSVDKVAACALRFAEAEARDGAPPIVVSTLVKPDAIAALRQSNAVILDFFGTFIGPLEEALGVKSTVAIGLSHGSTDSIEYSARIAAINFALAHDDGVSHSDLDKSDVILIGVSRSGKTPTSLYLALQFGIMAANYPLIPEDFERNRLPESLLKHRHKLFGLTIDPERLASIRNERRPDSNYSSLANCRWEIDQAHKMMRREGIRWLDSTTKSIEEISATLLQTLKL